MQPLHLKWLVYDFCISSWYMHVSTLQSILILQYNLPMCVYNLSKSSKVLIFVLAVVFLDKKHLEQYLTAYSTQRSCCWMEVLTESQNSSKRYRALNLVMCRKILFYPILPFSNSVFRTKYSTKYLNCSVHTTFDLLLFDFILHLRSFKWGLRGTPPDLFRYCSECAYFHLICSVHLSTKWFALILYFLLLLQVSSVQKW